MKKTFTLMLIASVALSACGPKGSENPLLQEWKTPFNVPPFELIKTEHYMPAYEEAMKQHVAEIDAIVTSTELPTFENTIVAYDKAGRLLRKISPVFSGINSASTTPELQEIAKQLSPIMSQHYDNIRLNVGLFQRVRAVYEQREELNLNAEQMRLLTEMYKGFVRGGAELSAEKQEQLRALNTQLAVLQTQFGQNMLAETGSYKLVIEDENELEGLSENLKTSAAERAKKNELEGKWVFGLDNPSIMPFLENAANREHRRELLTAYLNRCNNNNDKDNKEIVKQLVSLRLEKAQLMGYNSFAEFALEDRMAKTPENVYKLLNQLWTPALKVAKNELADMNNVAANKFVLEASDWRYYSAIAKNQKFDINDDMLRPYFKMENVRDGIFLLSNKLFGITFTQLTNVPVPNEETTVFECKDEDGSLLGLLFLDMYSRPGAKNGGAWCSRFRGQSYENGNRVAPLVTITCNFPRPSGDKPSLLSADETETFFHEFGHALHGLFSDVRYSGIGSVPRDFVELPSQIMEHWTFEPELLKDYAKHYETGEVIPAELVEKLDKSGKYGQGFATTEYLAASLLDMDYHVLQAIPENFDINNFEIEVLNKKRGLISQIPPRYRSTYFSHTMGGGYTAGYYSYIWAEVLDCDAYAAFKETGDIFNKEVAAKFRKEILSRGGQEDAMTMYLNFRGKEPNVKGLLDNRGLN